MKNKALYTTLMILMSVYLPLAATNRGLVKRLWKKAVPIGKQVIWPESTIGQVRSTLMVGSLACWKLGYKRSVVNMLGMMAVAAGIGEASPWLYYKLKVLFRPYETSRVSHKIDWSMIKSEIDSNAKTKDWNGDKKLALYGFYAARWHVGCHWDRMTHTLVDRCNNRQGDVSDITVRMKLLRDQCSLADVDKLFRNMTYFSKENPSRPFEFGFKQYIMRLLYSTQANHREKVTDLWDEVCDNEAKCIDELYLRYQDYEASSKTEQL